MKNNEIKKPYEKPEVKVEKIEIEDIIATSGTYGGSKPGDISIKFPWSK